MRRYWASAACDIILAIDAGLAASLIFESCRSYFGCLAQEVCDLYFRKASILPISRVRCLAFSAKHVGVGLD